jgi:GT2 family glycosyltransferase
MSALGVRPSVSVVVGSYNRASFLAMAIDSVRGELRGLPHEIIVVDGGSTDGTLAWLFRQKDVVTILQHNHGAWRGEKIVRKSWGHFMNMGFRCAAGRFVCMLSDDCLVVPGAIRNGLSRFEACLERGEKVGAVAFYWRNWPDQRAYRVGLTLGNRMFVNHGLYAKEALAAVGYADEERYAFYHADGDLCLRMWEAGYACVDSPDSYVEHYSHATPRLRRANSDLQHADWAAYLSRWEGIFFDRGKNDIGGWMEKEYADPRETALAFRRAAAGRVPVTGRLKALLGLGGDRKAEG